MILTAGDPNSDRRQRACRGRLPLPEHPPARRARPRGRRLGPAIGHRRSERRRARRSALGIEMPNNSGWRGGLRLKALQSNFNPALGFVSRSDVRETTADIGYTHFTRNRVLQSVFSGVDAQRIDFLNGGGLQSAGCSGAAGRSSGPPGTTLINAHYSASTEVVIEPFAIYDDGFQRVVVPPGRYSFGETILSLQTGGQRTFSGSATYRFGGFLSRHARQHRRELHVEAVQELRADGSATIATPSRSLRASSSTRNMRLQTDVNLLIDPVLGQPDSVRRRFGNRGREHASPVDTEGGAGGTARAEPSSRGSGQEQLVPVRAVGSQREGSATRSGSSVRSCHLRNNNPSGDWVRRRAAGAQSMRVAACVEASA